MICTSIIEYRSYSLLALVLNAEFHRLHSNNIYRPIVCILRRLRYFYKYPSTRKAVTADVSMQSKRKHANSYASQSPITSYYSTYSIGLYANAPARVREIDAIRALCTTYILRRGFHSINAYTNINGMHVVSKGRSRYVFVPAALFGARFKFNSFT